MTTVFDTVVNGLQGQMTQHVDVGVAARSYEMGRNVSATITLNKIARNRAANTALAANTAIAANLAAHVTVNQAPRAEKAGTKSQAVRELIRAARQIQGDAALVIAQAIGTLHMTRALATVYVKNNWNCN